jgi:hypothetical protein
MIGAEEDLRNRIPDTEEDPLDESTYVLRTPMVVYKQGEIRMVDVTLPRAEVVRIPKIGNALSPVCVAMSHVWAYGLGNPNANTLPECQVIRLQVCNAAFIQSLLYVFLLQYLLNGSTMFTSVGFRG